jgi:hypothetical protein
VVGEGTTGAWENWCLDKVLRGTGKCRAFVAFQVCGLLCPPLPMPWFGIWGRENHHTSLSAPKISNVNQWRSSRWRHSFKGMGKQVRVRGQNLTLRNYLLSLEGQKYPSVCTFGGGRQRVLSRDPHIVLHKWPPILLLLMPPWLAPLPLQKELPQSESHFCVQILQKVWLVKSWLPQDRR